MTGFLLIFLITSLLIAFGAGILTAVIKIIFFYRIENSYRRIFRVSLLAEAFGFVVMFLVYYFYKEKIDGLEKPEVILNIPTYTTLVGLLIGSILVYRSRKKQNQ